MKRLALTIVASIAALAMTASAAAAATFINYGPTGPSGGFTVTFGNTGVTDTNFTDTFDFVMPSGMANFVITSTMSSNDQKITFSSVAFNGEEFEGGSVGGNQVRYLNGVRFRFDDQKRLIVSGISGGNGSYSGVISFTPAAVPEPASWALMIGGFMGAGAFLRRARTLAA